MENWPIYLKNLTLDHNDDDAGDAFLLQKSVTKINRNQLKSFQFTRESDRIPVT